MRFPVGTLLALALLCLGPSGCESEVSKGDLGTVVFEVPKVPGAEKPYVFPQLEQATEASGDATGSSSTAQSPDGDGGATR
jgi:hypothetical protein